MAKVHVERWPPSKANRRLIIEVRLAGHSADGVADRSGFSRRTAARVLRDLPDRLRQLSRAPKQGDAKA